MWQPLEYRHTALAREPRREWIVDEAVRCLGLERPARSHHEGGVADVGDFALGWGHDIHYLIPCALWFFAELT
jgi:hypothetical protein